MNMITKPAQLNSAVIPDEPVLRIDGVTLQYVAGGHSVMATYKVSADVCRGDRFVLLGPSGCGKSTLLKAIGGFHRPADGQITLNGRVVTEPGPDRMMVFQEFDQLLPWKTVLENVAIGTHLRGQSGPIASMLRLDRADEARLLAEAARQIERVGLADQMHQLAGSLSLGQQRIVEIAQ